MSHTPAHLVERRRMIPTGGLLLLAAGTAIALLATVGGFVQFTDQLMAARTAKAETITLILSFGLVMVGPALFLAIAVLTPRRWLKTIRMQFRNRRETKHHRK